MGSKAYSVFVSCGTPYTAAQEDFLCAVEAHLRSHCCEPMTVGRSAFSIRQPVQAARDLIAKCDGAVVIAFERIRIVKAFDKPDSGDQKEINNESDPTIWNQMEAALAYGQQVPILTFVQSGLRRQGMLSDRFEWTAIEGDLSPVLLRADKVQQMFGEWLALVEQRRDSGKLNDVDPGELGVGRLITQLKPKQLWNVLAALFSIIAAVSVAAFEVGQFFQHHP